MATLPTPDLGKTQIDPYSCMADSMICLIYLGLFRRNVFIFEKVE